MIGVELTHHGDNVTSQTILAAFISNDPSSASWDRSSTGPTSRTTSTMLRRSRADAVIRGFSLTRADPDILTITTSS